jgi:hypothetical protein
MQKLDTPAGRIRVIAAGTSHGRVHDALTNTGGTADLSIYATTRQGDITARSL